jgi:cell division transport system permease protein
MSECPTGSRWREAFGSIGRRPIAWLAAVMVAGPALGAVLLLAIACWSLRPLVERSSIAPEVTVVLTAVASPAEVDALRNALSLLPAVSATRFVSRDAALAQIASRSPGDRDAIGRLANPLPDVVVLSFRADASPDAIESTAAAIKKMARVEAVDVDLAWYRKLWALVQIGVGGAWAVAAALVVHAAGWLAVAVALSGPIDARRAQLLWLLGADDRAARRAPVTAAGLTALAVAGIALVCARAGWQWLNLQFASVGHLYASTVQLQWPPERWLGEFVLAVVVTGLLIGSIRAQLCFESIRAGLASRKESKV